MLNIGLPLSTYQLEGSLLNLHGCPAIKLHMDWHHMNSSQILCIAYFYSFINNKNKLQKLVTDVLKINSEVSSAEFEYITSDGSNIDFVVHLKNGGTVFFEIKYTEREFGIRVLRGCSTFPAYRAIRLGLCAPITPQEK